MKKKCKDCSCSTKDAKAKDVEQKQTLELAEPTFQDLFTLARMYDNVVRFVAVSVRLKPVLESDA